MSTFGNISDNNDGSKNMAVGFVKEDGANTITGSLSVANYRERNPVTNRPQQMYSAAEGSLNFHHSGNPTTAGSLSVQHIPKFGNTATATAGIGVGSGTHRVGVEAFAKHTMPTHHQNFSTVGARIDAHAGKVGAHAGISHISMFRQTEQSVGASLNLHQTPTSSINLNVGSNRVMTPNHRGDWNHGIGFGLKKNF